MLPALVIGVGLLIAITVGRKLRQYYALRDFDGPWSVGFSRLWLLWANGSGKMNIVFTKVNDQYGKSTFRMFAEESIGNEFELDHTGSSDLLYCSLDSCQAFNSSKLVDWRVNPLLQTLRR